MTTTQAVETLVSKLGASKGVARSRIWIEGERLVRAGFTVGGRFDVVVRRDESGAVVAWELRSTADGMRKVSGKGASPIIDITGAAVRDAFPASSAVTCTFSQGCIEVRGV